jgi:GAF domain-containing protein
MSTPESEHEARRMDVLRSYDLLDTPPEQSFDDFALIASQVCGTPIAAITLVDEHRQWFKARVGLDVSETPREHAFCAHTIMSKDLMLVDDATKDPRFAANPLVTGDPNIRFYAGAPLVDNQGFGLGSLCVIDRKPRHLTPEQEKSLAALARQVVAQFEFRRISASLAEAVAEVTVLRDFLPICSYCKSVRNDQGYWNSIEDYMSAHSGLKLTHGICPVCRVKHYPELAEALAAKGVVAPGTNSPGSN